MNKTDRFQRQADLVPRDRLDGKLVTVIGVGAIGRQVALQLAAIGVPKLMLIDFDRVDTGNITTQGYSWADVTRPKVSVMCDAIRMIDQAIGVQTVDGRWRPTAAEASQITFCCVDTIMARTAIWRGHSLNNKFWVDARMLGEVIRVLTVTNTEEAMHYGSTLFAQADAVVGRCTNHSTIYAASIAAGLMVHQFTRWLRGIPVDKDITLNLLASEMIDG